MSSGTEIIFFGDFNCPFCFAESERLARLGATGDLAFRAIEHRPDLPVPWDRGAERIDQVFEDEIPRLRERAPEVPLLDPPAIPNTREANLAMAQCEELAPERCADLRLAIFRALWRDQKDISSRTLVTEIWEQLGLGERPPVTRDHRRKVRVWTVEWDTGPFDRRIPVLSTASGQRLLGLANPDAIANFLRDTSLGGHGTEVCRAED